MFTKHVNLSQKSACISFLEYVRKRSGDKIPYVKGYSNYSSQTEVGVSAEEV
jgi:hypothetical protein